MSYESSKRYEPSDTTAPRAWVSMLALSLLAAMMVITANFALNIYPKRSDFLVAEKLAAETYNQYSLKLEAIKKECLTELETIADED